MTENVPNYKNINLHIREIQGTPGRINSETHIYIVINCQKQKANRILKAAKEK